MLSAAVLKDKSSWPFFSLQICRLMLLLCCFSVVLTPAKASAEPSAIEVVASIKPLALLVEELLAPLAAVDVSVKVDVIVPINASPHGFNLKPSQLRQVLSAPLVIWIEAGFEPYLKAAIGKRGNKPQLAVGDLTGMLHLPAGEHGHHADPDHNHHHDSAGDPHLWWSAGNARLILTAMVEQLAQLYPEHASALEQSARQLQQRLLQQQQRLAKQPREVQRSALLYHDYLAYLEQELALPEARHITFSPEIKPSVKQLLSLSRWVQDQASCFVVEPGMNLKLLDKLDPQQRIPRIEIDPLGWDAADYSSMWRQAAEKLLGCHQ